MSDFKQEIDRVSQKVNALQNENTVSFAVVTDIHLFPRYPHTYFEAGVANMREVRRKTGVGTLFHLGDAPGGSENYPGSNWTQVWMDAALDKNRIDFSEAMTDVYFIPGNHDGEFTNPPTPEIWSPKMLPKESENVHVRPDLMSFYRDDPQKKVRYIGMMTAYTDLETKQVRYGIASGLIRWLATEAFCVPCGTAVFLFGHIPPCDVDADCDIHFGRQEFYDLCRAFTEKTVFRGEVYTADFTENGGFPVAMFCGHGHVDWVCNDERFPFPVIEVASFYPHYATWRMPHDAIPVMRKEGEEDLWDVAVYDTKTRVLNLVRFGAGEDRTILPMANGGC